MDYGILFIATGKWLSEDMNEFHKSSKKTLQTVTDAFKDVTQISVQNSYGLCVPIDTQLDKYHSTLQGRVDALLADWNFADKEMTIRYYFFWIHCYWGTSLQSPAGKIVQGFFNHHGIIAVIQDMVWPPLGKLLKHIPVNTTNLNCLLTFTVTIIQWVLENIWGGWQADFKTSIYCPYYIAALHCIEEGRHMNTISAQCLNATTHHIIQCRKDLVNISSSHSGM